MEEFQWPWQYSFPPFFSIQPNLDTRGKQIDAWKNLVLSYYKHFILQKHKVVPYLIIKQLNVNYQLMVFK